MLSIVIVWICSQAGWITPPRVGRQPWVIRTSCPRAAISDHRGIIGDNHILHVCLVFTVLLVLAEIGIIATQINKYSKNINEIAKS